MRYLALATDYDGTLARDGKVDDSVVAALESIRTTGRKLILVSGRILADLERVFSRIDLFDMIVAENGAVLYRPADASKGWPARKIPGTFIDELRSRGVSPLDEGDVIVRGTALDRRQRQRAQGERAPLDAHYFADPFIFSGA